MDLHLIDTITDLAIIAALVGMVAAATLELLSRRVRLGA